jgi:hypothetical protein
MSALRPRCPPGRWLAPRFSHAAARAAAARVGDMAGSGMTCRDEPCSERARGDSSGVGTSGAASPSPPPLPRAS